MSHLWSLPGILAKQDEPNLLAKPWRIKPEAGWEGNKKAPSRSQRTSEGQTKSTWALTHSVYWSIAGAQRHDWSQGAHEEERVRPCRGCCTGPSLNLYLMTSHLCHKAFGDWEGVISGSPYWNKRTKVEAWFKRCGGKIKVGQSCPIALYHCSKGDIRAKKEVLMNIWRWVKKKKKKNGNLMFSWSQKYCTSYGQLIISSLGQQSRHYADLSHHRLQLWGK